MASLQKFKLLATHCGTIAESPTRSPVIHLRRRKTLRMLLTRSSDRRRFPHCNGSPEIETTVAAGDSTDGGGGGKKREKIRSRRKLKELFVSSPPLEGGGGGGAAEETEGLLPVNGGGGGSGGGGNGFAARRIGLSSSLRPVSATLRCRLLRRPWRPVLVTIPEI